MEACLVGSGFEGNTICRVFYFLYTVTLIYGLPIAPITVFMPDSNGRSSSRNRSDEQTRKSFPTVVRLRVLAHVRLTIGGAGPCRTRGLVRGYGPIHTYIHTYITSRYYRDAANEKNRSIMIIGAGDGPADACTAIGPVYPSVRLVTPWPVHREPITADGPIMPGNLRLNTDAPPVSLHNGKPCGFSPFSRTRATAAVRRDF